MTNLWKFNKATGYWDLCRSCSKENAEEWLSIYQADEPNELFKLSKNKPKP